MKSKNDDLTSREAKGGVLNDYEIDGFGEWLSNAYSFKGDGNFTRWNMEVAYAAGMERAAKQAAEPVEQPRGDTRAAFEAWFADVPEPCPLSGYNEASSTYSDDTDNAMWQAWRAAYALPKPEQAVGDGVELPVAWRSNNPDAIKAGQKYSDAENSTYFWSVLHHGQKWPKDVTLLYERPTQCPAVAKPVEVTDFDALWDDEIRRNGGINIGADYRIWMKKGWDAAQEAAQPVGMRDSFESWYIKEHTLPDSPPIEMPRRPDGRYGVPMRDISWIAWQAALQEAAQPMGESREFVLRAMAMNYSEAHSWDHLDADACRRGADEIKSLRAALTAQPHASVVNLGEVVHVEARRCDVCDHIGVNDASETQGACHNCDWQGDEPKEDLCPGCGDTSCMAAACPECGGRYSLVASTEIAAQPHAEAKADIPRKQTPDDYGSGSDYQNMDGTDAAHMTGWNDCVDAMLAAAPEVPDV